MELERIPCTLNSLVREYASDILLPHPTACLIKALTLTQKLEQFTLVYYPAGLEVRCPDNQSFTTGKKTTRFTTTDFIPSFWSEYAYTFDGC